MLTLNFTESQITAKILNLVFGAIVEPSEILGLCPDQETVVIKTVYSLYSLGKEYFRSLVQKFKTQQQTKRAIAKFKVKRSKNVVQSGTVLLGDKVVTTGTYIGLGRRNAINNARNGLANKIAAMQLIQSLVVTTLRRKEQ